MGFLGYNYKMLFILHLIYISNNYVDLFEDTQDGYAWRYFELAQCNPSPRCSKEGYFNLWLELTWGLLTRAGVGGEELLTPVIKHLIVQPNLPYADTLGRRNRVRLWEIDCAVDVCGWGYD